MSSWARSMKVDSAKARQAWKVLWSDYQVALLGGREPTPIFRKGMGKLFRELKADVPIRARVRMRQYLARRRRRLAVLVETLRRHPPSFFLES